MTTTLLDPMGALDSDPRLTRTTKTDLVGAVSAAGIQGEPGFGTTQISSLLFGEPVQELERVRGFCRIARRADGYIGWVNQQALVEAGPPATHLVNRLISMRYIGPDLRAPAIRPLPLASLVHVVDQDDRFARLNDSTFVPSSHITSLKTRTADPVDVAQRYDGIPYVWGGRSPFGIDCSGLVQAAYYKAGYQLHRDSDLIRESLVRREDSDSVQRGDVACFKGHVGLMVDPDHMVHANQTHMGVTTDKMPDVLAYCAGAGVEFYGYYRLPDGLKPNT